MWKTSQRTGVRCMLLVVLLVYGTVCTALEIPEWVLAGILATETRSYYTESGSIIYVDRKTGRAGETGPFQMTRAAWLQIREKTEKRSALKTDLVYAELCCMRYLAWLVENDQRKNHTTDTRWDSVIQAYNAGPGNRSRHYLALVKSNARAAGYEVP